MALHKIGQHEVKLIPLRPVAVQFDKFEKKEKYLNTKGEHLKKIQMQKAEYKWVNTVTGEEHNPREETPSKSYKGQPIGYQEATHTVEEYEVCSLDILADYANISKTYQVLSETLKETLKAMKQVITFQYNSGKNYIPEKAIVYYDESKDAVLMRTLTGNMKDIDFSKTIESTTQVEVKEKAKPISITM